MITESASGPGKHRAQGKGLVVPSVNCMEEFIVIVPEVPEAVIGIEIMLRKILIIINSIITVIMIITITKLKLP